MSNRRFEKKMEELKHNKPNVVKVLKGGLK
jgi:hypothetical protein